MQVAYQLTVEDHYRGFKLVRVRRWRWWLGVVFAVLIVVSWLVLLILEPDRSVTRTLRPLALFCAVLLISACLLPHIVRASIRKQARKTPSAMKQMTLTVSDSGLHFHSDFVDSTIAWSSFIRWREDEAVFVLFTGPRFGIIIPKHAFAAECLAQFRETLKQSIVPSSTSAS